MNTAPRKRASTPTKNPQEPTKPESSTKTQTNQILLARELETALHTAFVNARARRHELITVEHLLFGLLDVPTSSEALEACNADIADLKSKLGVFIDENTPVVESKDDVDTQPTLGFQRVIQRAIMRVQMEPKSGQQVGCNDVLLAIFGEKDSRAVYYLHQQGVTRLDLVNFVVHGIKKLDDSRQNDRGTAEIIDEGKNGREFFTLLSDAQPFIAVEARKGDRPKLFVSYSHVDTSCVERLLVHLKPLERSNTVVCWSDRRLRTGDKWKTELEQNLSEAVIAILLVSADFLASDFIVNNELPPLLIKADSKGLRILPVILKPCGFRRDPVLSTFQSANDPATPLLGLSPIDQEALYDKIAEER